VANVCRVIEVTQLTVHPWRQQYGGMQAEEARRLTQLEKENARLKKVLAEVEMEKAMFEDLAEVDFCTQSVAAEPPRVCVSVTGF
jgi:putative transposase